MTRNCVLSIAVSLLVSVGCSKKNPTPLTPAPTPQLQLVVAFTPPSVEKGEPQGFTLEPHDVERLQAKMKPGAAKWLKQNSAGRYYIDWDAERQPFDTVVVHHSATAKQATSGEIERIQISRLYESRYKSDNNDPYIKGLPTSSGHVVNEKETFIGYHHLVYQNGQITTELSPLIKIDGVSYIDHVAWHAGDWGVNCRSLAICLVGDFSDEEPSEAQLRALAGLIVYYKMINTDLKVTAHSDHKATECPGKTWPLWSPKVFKMLAE